MRILALTTAFATAAVALAPVPASADTQRGTFIKVKESRHKLRATGAGFTVFIDREGVRTEVEDDEFGDPSGEPIARSAIDLSTRPTPPIVCEGGNYTMRSGTFTRTIRVSRRAVRPAPYSAAFAASFPGILSPFVGVVDATATNDAGETFRVFISDLAHEELTPKGFVSDSPIHGLIVDSRGKVRDRISLFGRFSSGPNGENARHSIEDRGTCRSTAPADAGPVSAGATMVGPFFVLPFRTTIVRP